MTRNSPAERMAHLDGIVAVPPTAFTDSGEVDVESLQRFVRSYLERGVAGFLAPAVAGEVGQLNAAERELVVTTILAETEGRVPVIGGATADTSEQRFAAARRLTELGCDAVLAWIRYEDAASYTEAVRAVAAAKPHALMIQDIDSGDHVVPVELLARLHRELPCFNWIKLETPDRMRKMSALRALAGPSLRIGTAGPDLIEALDRGADAYLPSLYPESYSLVWRRHRAGARAEAIAHYREMLPSLAFMATHPAIQWRFTKAILHAEGLFATQRIRISAPELDPIEGQLVAELCQHAMALRGKADREFSANG